MKLIFSEEKINLLAPLFISAFVFFIPISSTMKSILLFCCLAALFVTPYYRHYLSNAFNAPWARFALILFVIMVGACFWSEASLAMRFNIINKYSKLVFLPLLAVGCMRSQTRKWILNSYLGAVFLTCILCLLKSINISAFNTVTNDAGAVFYNHIVTGYMIALGVYLAGFQLFKPEISGYVRLYSLSLVLLGSYQIFFINTGRTGYLIYALLMTLLIVQKMPFKKAIIGILGFCFIMIIAFTLSPIMQSGARAVIHDIQLLQQHQENSSIGFRVQFHRYAQSLFKEHPLVGVGSGGFQHRFIKDQPVPAWGEQLHEPHGQYWLILAEQGLLGISIFLLFLASLFIASLKLQETKPILLGVLLSFCAVCFSDTVFCYSPVGYLFILFSALCLGELLEKTFVVKELTNA